MIDGFLRGLRQPEYVHVLLNPLPVYGLLISWIALIVALISKSRRALIVTLILVFISSISAWPVYEFYSSIILGGSMVTRGSTNTWSVPRPSFTSFTRSRL